MKIYIASKTKHAKKWLHLRADGLNITSTWIDEFEEGQTASYEELADRCITEAKEADITIVYCEPGEILKGALIEVGAALANDKKVCLVGNCQSISRVFRAHKNWHEFLNMNRLTKYLKGI